MIPTFDLSLFPPGSISLKLVGGAVESPRALSGLSGAIDFAAGGSWSLKLKKIMILADPRQHRAWLALDGILAGGVAKVNVATVSSIAMPGATPGASRGDTGFVSSIRHEGGVPFSNGAGHSASVCLGEFAAAAEEGAATVKIRILTGQEVVPGPMFGTFDPVKGWRMYRILAVDSVSDGVATVWIRPPLRAGAPAGRLIDFDKPRCVMRLPAGQSLGWEPEADWRFSPDVTLVEAMDAI